MLTAQKSHQNQFHELRNEAFFLLENIHFGFGAYRGAIALTMAVRIFELWSKCPLMDLAEECNSARVMRILIKMELSKF